MGLVTSLICRECQGEIEPQATHVCDVCFGPLEVRYDQSRLSQRVTRESITAGPNSIWRYRELLPVPDEVEPVTLGEGMTPLVHARRLGSELGLDNLRRAPVLVVEVLSGSTRRIDLGTKRLAFEAAGVPSYWLVDPDEPGLIVLELAGGHYEEAARVTGAESWTAASPFPVRIVPVELAT